MKTACKIAFEFFLLLALTFMLSLEHIIIANVYDIPYLAHCFVAAYCLCCWLSHRSCGMHNERFGVAITMVVSIVTFFSVECVLHKDEKGCQDWVLETIETFSRRRISDRHEPLSAKEQSFGTAIKILSLSSSDEIIKEIHELDDVEALRVIAFAAHIASWPMRASSDIDFDNRMDSVFQSAMQKLFLSDSDAAHDAIEHYKRAFPPDGAYSLFFKEREEERKSLQLKRESDVRVPESTIRPPQNCQP